MVKVPHNPRTARTLYNKKDVVWSQSWYRETNRTQCNRQTQSGPKHCKKSSTWAAVWKQSVTLTRWC